MSRNMLRRIEIAWPIQQADMQQRIMQECLMPYLADTDDAWVQIPHGQYALVNQQSAASKQGATVHSAQKQLIKRYSAVDVR